MKIHNVAQGSDAWHALRADYHTASEAPVMMGASKQMKRTELLHAKKTGLDRDISWWVQKYLFDKGHEAEALARPILEARIDEDLFPVVGTEGDLLASLDGCTIMGETLFEHKMWNEQLAADVLAGTLDPHYYWQLEQQLLVSGAEKVIFVCSDGTEDKFVSMEYFPIPGRAATLVAGWKQFESDLVDYTPQPAAIEVVAAVIETLPTLSVQLEGAVKSSNLPAFQSTVMARIKAINTDLQTDQHFADAEEMVKFCDKAEKNIDLVKANALAQTASIDELFATLSTIQAELRNKRLMLDKLVKARKIAIREEIVLGAAKALQAHIDQINSSFGGKVRLPVINADFAGAIKGKRTIASLRDGADSELARVKIEASQIGDGIRVNLESLRTLAIDHAFLFVDAQQLVLKANDDLVSMIKVRISEHQKAEEEKAEAQREQIRKEERERLEQEQKLEADRVAAEATAIAAPVVLEAMSRPTSEPTTVKPAATQLAPSAPKLAAVPASKPEKYRAEVMDLEALIHAVAGGLAPLSVLTVNWEALDTMVATQGSLFSMAGVTLTKVAA